MMSPFLRRVAILVAVVPLAGCAGRFVPDCKTFEQERKQTDYATHYTVTESGATRRGAGARPPGPGTAAATVYRLTLDAAEFLPCTHVKVTKELFLQRNPGRGDVLEETREFIAENGRVIATRREIVTGQLPQTGLYTATVPFPLAAGTPSGKYRITSRLVFRPRGNARQAQVLARSGAEFVVLPQKK